MTFAPLRNATAPGAPIVIVPGTRGRYHFPAPGEGIPTGKPVSLEEHLEAGGAPVTWPTLCAGQRGHVFLLGPLFNKRQACPECVVAMTKAVAA